MTASIRRKKPKAPLEKDLGVTILIILMIRHRAIDNNPEVLNMAGISMMFPKDGILLVH